MDYTKISQEVIGHLYKAHTSIRRSGVDIKLLALADLRIAQINGCAYCCGFHSKELRELGMDQSVIDRLPGWRLSSVFGNKQKLVLQWTEAITKMEHSNLGDYRKELEAHFSEKELVDLTAGISLMNALTRLRITLGDEH